MHPSRRGNGVIEVSAGARGHPSRACGGGAWNGRHKLVSKRKEEKVVRGHKDHNRGRAKGKNSSKLKIWWGRTQRKSRVEAGVTFLLFSKNEEGAAT